MGHIFQRETLGNFGRVPDRSCSPNITPYCPILYNHYIIHIYIYRSFSSHCFFWGGCAVLRLLTKLGWGTGGECGFTMSKSCRLALCADWQRTLLVGVDWQYWETCLERTALFRVPFYPAYLFVYSIYYILYIYISCIYPVYISLGSINYHELYVYLSSFFMKRFRTATSRRFFVSSFNRDREQTMPAIPCRHRLVCLVVFHAKMRAFLGGEYINA